MRTILALLVLTSTAWADEPPASLADEPPPASGGRIAGEVALGVVIGGAGMLGGGALGSALECSSDCHGFLAGAAGAVIGGYIGGSIGIGVGIGLVGGDDVSRGSMAVATSGALLGGLAGVGAAAAIGSGSHGSAALGVTVAAAGWIGGGLVGYHLSRRRIVSTVVPTPQGLALAGTF